MTMYAIKRRGRTVFAVADDPQRADRALARTVAEAELSRDHVRLEVIESADAERRVIVRNGKRLTIPMSR